MTDPSVGSSVSSTSGLKNPAIAQLPTKGGDDDEDEDEDEEDEDEEDDEEDDD
jgi:ribosomal protein L12E/L44/L45/RPP1/RPP2